MNKLNDRDRASWKKQIFSLIITLIFLMGSMPVTVFAGTNATVNGSENQSINLSQELQGLNTTIALQKVTTDLPLEKTTVNTSENQTNPLEETSRSTTIEETDPERVTEQGITDTITIDQISPTNNETYPGFFRINLSDLTANLNCYVLGNWTNSQITDTQNGLNLSNGVTDLIVANINTNTQPGNYYSWTVTCVNPLDYTDNKTVGPETFQIASNSLANLSLKINSTKDVYSKTDPINFTINILNTGTDDLSNIVLTDNFNNNLMNLTSTNCALSTGTNLLNGTLKFNITACRLGAALLPNQTYQLNLDFNFIGPSIGDISTNDSVSISAESSNGTVITRNSSKEIMFQQLWFENEDIKNTDEVNPQNTLNVSFIANAKDGYLDKTSFVIYDLNQNKSVFTSEIEQPPLQTTTSFSGFWDGRVLIDNQTTALDYQVISEDVNSSILDIKGYIGSDLFELFYNYSFLNGSVNLIKGTNDSSGINYTASILNNLDFVPRYELLSGGELNGSSKLISNYQLDLILLNDSYYTLQLRLLDTIDGFYAENKTFGGVRVLDSGSVLQNTTTNTTSNPLLITLVSPSNGIAWDGTGDFNYIVNYTSLVDCQLSISNGLGWSDSVAETSLVPGFKTVVYDTSTLINGSVYYWNVSCRDTNNISKANVSNTFAFTYQESSWQPTTQNINYTPLWSQARNVSFLPVARELFRFAGAPYVVRGPGCKLEMSSGGLENYMNSTPGENCCSDSMFGACPTTPTREMIASDLGAVWVDQAQDYLAWHIAGPGTTNDTLSYCTNVPNNVAYVIEFDEDNNLSTGCDKNTEGCYPGADYQIWFFPDNKTALFAYYNGSQASVTGKPAGVGNCSNNPGSSCFVANDSVQVDVFVNCSPDYFTEDPKIIDDGITLIINKSVLPEPIKLNFETNTFNVSEATSNPIDQLTNDGYDSFLNLMPTRPGSDCSNNDGNESGCLSSSDCKWIPLGTENGLCEPDFEKFTQGTACFTYDNTNQSACENSSLGNCKWVPNATTPKGVQNLCVESFLPSEFTSESCDSVCSSCFSETQCENSEANGGKDFGGCEWYTDPLSQRGWCDIKGLPNGCNDSVSECLDNTSCETRINGGYWNSTYEVCQEHQGDEICFNHIDDDGDGLIDCNDPDCQDLKYCAAGINRLTGLLAGASVDDALFAYYAKGLGPVIPLAQDSLNDSTEFTNILQAGISVGSKSLGIGLVMQNLSDLKACGGLETDRKFLFFIDTDLNETTGCNFTLDGQQYDGYDYIIKYGDYDQVNQSGQDKLLLVCNAKHQWVLKDAALVGLKNFDLTSGQTTPMECGDPNGFIQNEDIAGIVIDKSALGNPTQNLKFSFAVINGSWDNMNNLSSFDNLLNVYYTPGSIGFVPVDCFKNPTACGSEFMVIGDGNFMPSEDCMMPGDEDLDGLVNCADPDCAQKPICSNDPNKYNISKDVTAPRTTSSSVNALNDKAFLHWTTDEPTNGTILFYGTDSNCEILDNNLFDEGLPGTFDDYIPWHDIVIDNQSIGTNLLSGTTYYYRILNYDLAGNKGLSACLNFTTLANPQNISMLLNYTPNNTTNNTDFLGNLTVLFDGVPVDLGQPIENEGQTSVNITFYNPTATPDKNWSITLIGANFLQATNLDFTHMFLANNTGNGVIVGMPNFGWSELSQTLGVTSILIRIPNNADTLFHCDDNGTICVDVTNDSGVNKTASGSGWSEWRLPVTLGFSTYSTGTGTTYTLLFNNLNPIQQHANLSQNITFILNLTNNDTTTNLYNISIDPSDDPNLYWDMDPTQLSLGAGQSGIVSITVNSAVEGLYYFNVTAVFANDSNISFNSYDDFDQSYLLNTTQTTQVANNSLTFTNLTPVQVWSNLSQNFTYILNLTNKDIVTHLYNISINPDNDPNLAWFIDPTQLSLGAGQSGIVSITVNSAVEGLYYFNVSAVESDNASALFSSYDDIGESYLLNTTQYSNGSISDVFLTSCPGDNINNNTVYYLSNDFANETTWQGNFAWQCITLTGDKENITIDCNGHQIIGNGSTQSIAIYGTFKNITIKNCVFSNVTNAIYTNGLGSDLTIENNTVFNYSHSETSTSEDGAFLLKTITESEITNNSIDLDYSSYKSGIVLLSSSNVLIDGNNFKHLTSNSSTSDYQYAGIEVGYDGEGSSNVTIRNNNFERVSVGLKAINMTYSTIYNNSFLNVSGRDVFVESNSSNNLFFENHFMHNLTVWDNGVNNNWNNSQVGNYWLEYNGVDDGYLENDSNACVDANQDGICDEPYHLSGTAGAIDYRPISEAVPSPEITVSKYLVEGDNYTYTVGDTIEYAIEIENTGDYNLTNILVEDDFNSEELSYLNSNCNDSIIGANLSAGNESYVEFNISNCLGEPLTIGQSKVFYINFTAQRSGYLTNDAFAEASNEENSSEIVNDTSRKTTDVEGVVSFNITQTLLNSPLFNNQTALFKIFLVNNGTEIIDDYYFGGDSFDPSKMSLQSASCQILDYNATSGRLALNLTDCNSGNLIQPGDNLTIYLNFTTEDTGLTNNSFAILDMNNTVYSENTYFFTINRPLTAENPEFYNGTDWKPISSLNYGEPIQKLRVTCENEADQSQVTNAYFTLKNLNGSVNEILDENSTSNINNTLFELDSTDFINKDSGTWSLTGTCVLANGSVNSVTQTTNIPWGHLSLSLSQNNPNEVQKDSFFNFTTSVKCQGGECQDVRVYLDPEVATQNERISAQAIERNAVLSALDKNDEVEVIVNLKNVPTLSKLSVQSTGVQPSRQVTIESTERSFIESTNLPVKEKFKSFNSVIVRVNKNNVVELLNNPLVESYQVAKRNVHADLNVAVPHVGANKLWSYQINGHNITGAGMTACVIDTGINYSLPDFGGYATIPNPKVIGSYCFVDDMNLSDDAGWCPNGLRNGTDVTDDEGHGTHVSGIIASEDSVYRGVAPQARLVEVKALASDGSGWNTDIVKAIDWCVSHKDEYNISVISMSLGSGGYDSVSSCEASNPSYTTAINAAVANNISVFVASGNNQSGYFNKVAAPACVGNAIAVSAVNDSDVMAYFAQAGPLVDLVAPGFPIVSTYYHGGHVAMSGTSMAAPMAAGMGLLIQEYNKELYGTNLQPSRLLNIMQENSVDVDDTANSGYHYDRINIASASNIIGLKGLVPVNDSSSSFYTVDYNPYNETNNNVLSSLSDGQEINISWRVNATGGYNTWSFFAYTKDYLDEEVRSETMNVSIIDNTTPSVQEISPINNITLSTSNTTLKFELSDGFDKNLSCDLYLDGQLDENTVWPTGVVINETKLLTEGEHYWQINCTDAYGNTNQSNKAYFIVDNSTPIYTDLQMNETGIIDIPKTILISANWSDNYLQNVSLYFTNGTLIETKTTSGGLVTFNWLADANNAEKNISFYMIGRDKVHQKQTVNTSSIYLRSAPFVKTPINNITISEDSNNVNIINLSNNFFDYNNQTLIYTIVDNESDVYLTETNGLVSINSTNNFNGNVTVTITASDGTYSANDTFIVEVTPVDDAPTVVNPISDQSLPEDTVLSDIANLTQVFNDVDSTNLTYILITNNSDVELTKSNNMLTITASNNFNGVVSASVIASDGELNVSDNFLITVTPVNDAPVITSTPKTIGSTNSTYEYDVNAVDVDDTNLTYYLVQAPTNMTINPVTGLIQWIVGETVGNYTVTVNVSDPEGASDSQTYTLRIYNSSAITETSFSTRLINDYTRNLTITANYSLEMNTSIIPDLTFTPEVNTTLNCNPGIWTNNKSIQFFCTVTDNNVTINGINITIANGRDILLDRLQAVYNEENALKIDTQEPYLTSISIASNNTNSSIAKIGDKISLEITSNEELNTTSSVVQIDGETVSLNAIDTTHYLAEKILDGSEAEGYVTFSVQVKDLSQNQGVEETATTDNSKVLFDRTAPVLYGNSFTVLNNSAYEENKNYQFSINVNESVGLANVTLSINGLTHSAHLGVGNNYYFTQANLSAGSYNMTWLATDLAGNKNNFSFVYAVRKAEPVIILKLNNQTNNLTVGVDTNISLEAMTNITQGTMDLTLDGSTINSGLGTLTNVVSFTHKGTHLVKVLYSETENYTSTEKELELKVIDNIPPELNLTSPENNSLVNINPVKFNYRALDRNGKLTNCDLYVDGVKKLRNTTMINETSENNFTKLLNGGEHTWKIVCEDDSNNTKTSLTRVLRLDTQKPITTIKGIVNNGLYNTEKQIQLIGTDYGLAGINKTLYRIDSGNWTIYQNPINYSTEGSHTIEYYSVDNANNTESIKSVNFTMDFTAPAVTETSPVAGSNLSNLLTVKGTLAGASTTIVTIDGNTTIDIINVSNGNFTTKTVSIANIPGEGSHTIKIYSYDDVGNENITETPIILDRVKPESSILMPNNNLITNKPSINLTGTVSDSTSGVKELDFYDGTSWIPINFVNNTWNLTYTFPQEGEYIFKTKATDNAGNTELPTKDIKVIFDQTAPMITNVKTSANPVTTNKTIRLSVKVTDQNGISEVKSLINGEETTLNLVTADTYEGNITTPSITGNYTITIIANDTAGNQAINNEVNLTIDSTKPTIEVTPVNGSFVSNNTLINISLPDKDTAWYNASSNANHTTITGSNEQFRINSNDGPYSLTVWANNSLGSELSITREYTVDNTAPELNVSSLIQYTNKSLITISGNVTETNLDSVKINGVAITLGGNSFTKNLTLTEGVNTIKVVATDKAGNSVTNTQTVHLDTITPQTSVQLSESQKTWYNKPITVNFIVDDGNLSSGVQSQYWNGTEWLNASSLTINKTMNLIYRSIDKARNTEANKTFGLIQIDEIKPQVNTFQVSNVVVPVNKTVIFTANLSDNESGLSRNQNISINGTVLTMVEKAPGIYEQAYTPTKLGNIEAIITAEDVAGNKETKTINISVVKEEEDIGYTFVNDSYNIRNFTRQIDTELNINVNQSVTGNLTVSQFAVLPVNVNETLTHAPMFLHFNVSSNINQSLDWILIKIYYNESELRGINESDLTMHWYNESNGHWVELSTNLGFVHSLGVNTAENYVWANVTHFSTYSFTGDEINCSDVLNSDNKITEDCYYDSVFHEADSGYICSGSFKTSKCSTTNTTSETTDGATSGTTSPSTDNTTTVPSTNKTTSKSPKTEKITPTSDETTINKTTEGANGNNNSTGSINSSNQTGKEGKSSTNNWLLIIMLLILLTIVGAVIYVKFVLDSNKK